LEAIGEGNEDKVEHLLEALSSCNVSVFESGGRLGVVLCTCAASLIMHHFQVTKEMTPVNVISSNLYKAARKAKNMDPRYPAMSQEQVLDQWSLLVKQRFMEKIVETASTTLSLGATMDNMMKMMTTVSATIMDLKAQNSDFRLTVADQKSQVAMLQGLAQHLKEQVTHANRKLAIFRTPRWVLVKSDWEDLQMEMGRRMRWTMLAKPTYECPTLMMRVIRGCLHFLHSHRFRRCHHCHHHILLFQLPPHRMPRPQQMVQPLTPILCFLPSPMRLPGISSSPIFI
jgi:hypothetical protein